jgi:hypothetical protein
VVVYSRVVVTHGLEDLDGAGVWVGECGRGVFGAACVASEALLIGYCLL